MFITYEVLQAKDACEGQALRFKALFPDGCTVTAALCGTHTREFEWSWAAKNLLSPSARAEYEQACAPAWAGYEQARDTARAEYEQARALASAEYKRACDTAWAGYDRARDTARAEYERAPALAEYKRACAEAFGRLAEKED
jgi:hypothetical protein